MRQCLEDSVSLGQTPEFNYDRNVLIDPTCYPPRPTNSLSRSEPSDPVNKRQPEYQSIDSGDRQEAVTESVRLPTMEDKMTVPWLVGLRDNPPGVRPVAASVPESCRAPGPPVKVG